MFVIVATSLEFDAQVYGPFATAEEANASLDSVALKFAHVDEGDDLQISVRPIQAVP